MLRRDVTNLNGVVEKTPDLQNVLSNQSDLNDAAQAAAETIAKQIGAYADKQRSKALEAALSETDPQQSARHREEAQAWAEGGDYRVALHAAGGALTGGLTGGGVGAVGGAAGAAASAKLAPQSNEIARSIKEAGPTGNADVDQLLGNLASNVLAGGAGALAGGSTGALAAAAGDRFNRQLHEEDREQGKRLATLSKEKGLSYTEGDIANQQALMDLTVGGKNYYGENQVATGEKPQDGTDWSYYGQNVKGEPVWAQSVQRGDPDLQAFIANNTNGKTANGMTYEATTIGKNPGLFRMPDFVNFQVDYFVGSVWGTFTREGKSYFGYGTNMALPNPVQASTSITAGWLNKSSVAPGQVDDFMKGYAGGATGAYGLVGGGMMYSPGNGAATLIGIGGGVSAAKAPNVGGVGGGYTVEQGKTRMEW